MDPKNAHKDSNPKVFLDILICGMPLKRITIELFQNIVPKTAENFRALCTGENGFGYKDSLFHRVLPGFICHGGDIVNNNGTGGKSIYGATFEDENFKVLHSTPGVLSMVNTGPNSNNSQFVITLSEAGWLNNKYVAFGHVLSGTDALKVMEGEGSEGGDVRCTIKIANCGQLP